VIKHFIDHISKAISWGNFFLNRSHERVTEISQTKIEHDEEIE